MDLIANSIDFNKTPKQILISVISKTNGIHLNPDDYSLSIPQIVDVTSPKGKKLTTAIELTSVAAKGVKGKRTVYYNRINLANYNLENDYVIPAGDYKNISDVLSLINEKYKIVISKDDIIDGPIPAFTGTDPSAVVNITLVANPLSILFSGSTGFSILRPDVDINDLITDVYLEDIAFTY